MGSEDLSLAHAAVMANSVNLVENAVQDFEKIVLSKLLQLAVTKKRDNVIDVLVRDGAVVNDALLIDAVKGGSLACVRKLLEHKANVDAVDDDKHSTVLLIALRKRRFDIAEVLLEHGAVTSDRLQRFPSYDSIFIACDPCRLSQLFDLLRRHRPDLEGGKLWIPKEYLDYAYANGPHSKEWMNALEKQGGPKDIAKATGNILVVIACMAVLPLMILPLSIAETAGLGDPGLIVSWMGFLAIVLPITVFTRALSFKGGSLKAAFGTDMVGIVNIQACILLSVYMTGMVYPLLYCFVIMNLMITTKNCLERDDLNRAYEIEIAKFLVHAAFMIVLCIAIPSGHMVLKGQTAVEL